MVRWFVCVVVAGLVVVGTLPRSLRAQADTVTSLATISTDTGALAPGPHDYTRYDTPGLCRAAIAWTRRMHRQSLAYLTLIDTLHDAPQRDTMDVEHVTAVAQQCGTRFFSGNSPIPARFAVLDLLLAAQQDSLAAVTVAQRLAAVTGPQDQDSVTLQAIGVYLDATPARFTAAEALIAQLDAAGRSHLVARIQAHDRLRQTYDMSRERAKSLQQAEWIIALGQEATAEELGRLQCNPHARCHVGAGALARGYQETMLWDKVYEPDSIPALCARGYQNISKLEALPPETKTVNGACEALTGEDPTTKWFGNSTPLPHLQADFWFPSHSGETAAPTSGAITLYVALNPRNYQPKYFFDNEPFVPVSDVVRRLLARYGASGLVVKVVTLTRGWTWMDGAVPAAQEAERARWFIQDFEHLPVGIVVQQSHNQWRPAPDGRRIFDKAGQDQFDTFMKPGGANPYNQSIDDGDVVLVGRNGQLLYRGNINMGAGNSWHISQFGMFSPEDRLDLQLQQLLSIPGSANPMNKKESSLSADSSSPSTHHS